MRRAVAGQLGACFLLVAVSGCLSHQSRHSIRRAWIDFNSLGQPAVVFQQTDHLPYHADRVGHYLWMYGSTPGHQNVYKSRRYQKDLQTGVTLAPEETAPAGRIVGKAPFERAAGRVESPHPKPPAPPVDVPAPSASPRPASRPLLPPAPPTDPPHQLPPRPRLPLPVPPKPAHPQPIGPVAAPERGPTAHKSAPSGWTAYRGER